MSWSTAQKLSSRPQLLGLSRRSRALPWYHRVQQLEEENDEMKLNVCRLKSQTEKLDQVRSGFIQTQILSDINRPT